MRENNNIFILLINTFTSFAEGMHAASQTTRDFIKPQVFDCLPFLCIFFFVSKDSLLDFYFTGFENMIYTVYPFIGSIVINSFLRLCLVTLNLHTAFTVCIQTDRLAHTIYTPQNAAFDQCLHTLCVSSSELKKP